MSIGDLERERERERGSAFHIPLEHRFCANAVCVVRTLLKAIKYSLSMGAAAAADGDDDGGGSVVGRIGVSFPPLALALISGCLGSLGAAMGKIAFSSSSHVGEDGETHDGNHYDDDVVGGENVSEFISLAASRLLPLACMLAINALMVATFLEALRGSDAVSVNVASSCANFASSAFLGISFFGEDASRMLDPWWWAGVALIVAGVGVVQNAQASSSPPKEFNRSNGNNNKQQQQQRVAARKKKE